MRCWIGLIRDETPCDDQLAALLQVLESECPSSKQQLPIEVRPFWDNRHLFTQIDGIILRGEQIVIPKVLRPRMIMRAHARGSCTYRYSQNKIKSQGGYLVAGGEQSLIRAGCVDM